MLHVISVNVANRHLGLQHQQHNSVVSVFIVHLIKAIIKALPLTQHARGRRNIGAVSNSSTRATTVGRANGEVMRKEGRKEGSAYSVNRYHRHRRRYVHRILPAAERQQCAPPRRQVAPPDGRMASHGFTSATTRRGADGSVSIEWAESEP